MIYKTLNVAQDFGNLLKRCINDVPIKREIELRHISILNSVNIDMSRTTDKLLGWTVLGLLAVRVVGYYYLG
jgi:hypothetical protein